MDDANLILQKLDEIVGHLRDLNTLAERREKNREASARYRARQSATPSTHSSTSSAPSASSTPSSTPCVTSPTCVISPKENEEGKENIPPTPPIREKGEEKENVVVVESRAREANESDLEKLLHSDELIGKRIPSLTQVMAFVETALGKTKAPRDRVEEWYRKTLLAKWEDGDGNPIKNWGRNLNMFLFYYDRNQKSADPACLPDARQRGASGYSGTPRMVIKHADNWRGTRPEDIGNVLG